MSRDGDDPEATGRRKIHQTRTRVQLRATSKIIILIIFYFLFLDFPCQNPPSQPENIFVYFYF